MNSPRILDPHVVLRPRVRKLSFTAMGTPRRGLRIPPVLSTAKGKIGLNILFDLANALKNRFG
jgi:hypothetical protein